MPPDGLPTRNAAAYRAALGWLRLWAESRESRLYIAQVHVRAGAERVALPASAMAPCSRCRFMAWRRPQLVERDAFLAAFKRLLALAHLSHQLRIRHDLQRFLEALQVVGADQHGAGMPLRVTTTRSCSRATRPTSSEKRALTDDSGRVSDMVRILANPKPSWRRRYFFTLPLAFPEDFFAGEVVTNVAETSSVSADSAGFVGAKAIVMSALSLPARWRSLTYLEEI